MREVSVIIPQHGQCGLTVAAIESLQRHHSRAPEIIVVDDASSACERRQLQTAGLRGVQIVPAGRHRGVTSAWNLGWRQTRRALAVFLNNDTVSTGDWLTDLSAPLRDGAARVTGVGFRQERHLPQAFRDRIGQSRVLEGWCFAIRREELERLSGFDERLRLYFSDTDFQCRILEQAGDRGACLSAVPSLPLTHLGHRSTRMLAWRSRQWEADRDFFVRKWSRCP